MTESEAPSPEAVADATAEVSRMQRDPEFTRRLAAGDGPARYDWLQMNRTKNGEPGGAVPPPQPSESEAREKAKTDLARLMADKGAVQRMQRGDRAVLQQYRELLRQSGRVPDEGDGAAGDIHEADASLQPPESPRDYRFDDLLRTMEPEARAETVKNVSEAAFRMEAPAPMVRMFVHAVNEARKAGPVDPEKLEAQGAEVTEQFRKEWGSDFDKRLAAVRAVVRDGGEEFAALLEETGLGNDPTIIRNMDRLAAARQRRRK